MKKANMTIEPMAVDQDATVRISFGRAKNNDRPVLVLKAVGNYGIGSNGNINGRYLTAMVSAACTVFTFSEFVFDFADLEYEMSDSLGSCIWQLFRMKHTDMPVAINVSAANRGNITSLLTMMKLDANVKLIEGLDEA